MRFFWILLFMNIVVADYGGGYAGSGLRYGSNAREFSLAGTLIADKTPGFQAFSNPALLQFTRSNQVGVSFQNMSLDRSIKSFSFAKRLPANAGVGLALLQSGTDNIQGKNLMNQMKTPKNLHVCHLKYKASYQFYLPLMNRLQRRKYLLIYYMFEHKYFVVLINNYAVHK